MIAAERTPSVLTLAEQKAELRRAALLRRGALSREAQEERDRALCRVLLASSAFRRASCLLTYAAIRGEPDLSPVTEVALAAGLPVGYPVARRGGEMRFFRVSGIADLTPGFAGIPEPPGEGGELLLDSRTLCLVPGLCFDSEGFRIGYGGGFYDRFSRGFFGILLGIAPAGTVIDRIPREEHDRPLSGLVREDGIRMIIKKEEVLR